jgi:hypothetical protein
MGLHLLLLEIPSFSLRHRSAAAVGFSQARERSHDVRADSLRATSTSKVRCVIQLWVVRVRHSRPQLPRYC